jgi:hypothetical protein
LVAKQVVGLVGVVLPITGVAVTPIAKVLAVLFPQLFIAETESVPLVAFAANVNDAVLLLLLIVTPVPL